MVKVEQPKRPGNGRWLTAASAAEYLDFTHCKNPTQAFRMFARRAKLVPGRRGDVPVYHTLDLDLAVDPNALRRLRLVASHEERV